MNKLHNKFVRQAKAVVRPHRLLCLPMIFALVFSFSSILVEGSSAGSLQKRSQNKKPAPDKKTQPDKKPLPEAVIDSNKYDFGEVFIGETLEHVFWVRNLGSVPLELSEGGPVAEADIKSPGSFIRAVSFRGFDGLTANGFAASTAGTWAAPS